MNSVTAVVTIIMLGGAACAPVQKAPSPPGSQPAPKVSFYGVEDRARRIVYSCDCSGSIAACRADVMILLNRSVAALHESQAFDIVLWRTDGFESFGKSKLVRASPEQKRRADAFLQGVIPAGKTNPIPALEAGLAEEPDVMFLLTDGEFPDNKAVIEWLRVHNAQKRVRINVIDLADIKVLRQIAAENGGTYQRITWVELEALFPPATRPASSPAGTAPRAD